VNPSNPYVLLPHLACAAYERPLTPEDETFWGDDLDDGVRQLVLDDRVVVRGERAVYAGRGAPALLVGLRTGSSDSFRIVDASNDARLIGTVDGGRAFEVVHPGAIYLHQGQQYRVDRLDLDDRAAWVVPTDADETTQPRTDIDIRILSVDDTAKVGRAMLHVGSVEVWTGEVLGIVPLDLPPSRLETRAFWYTVDDRVLAAAGIAPMDVPGTLHAAEHAGIGILPLFTICDRWDVGGVSTPVLADTGKPTIVIYDGYPGGAGIAELGFAAGRRHLEATLEVVAACPCEAGCPSCVQSPKCGNWNEPLDKVGAIALLEVVLGR
jgi:DEAD/DEAH box helicase domain-containing protein